MQSLSIAHTDEALVEEIYQGDKELFGELIDRYEAKLTRYVRRFTQEKDDIDDIVQTIFVKAYTHLNSFDTSRSFNSWIYRIAHNESVTYLKRKGEEKVSFIDFDTFFPHPFAKEESDALALSNEQKKLLESSLSKLPPKYREVLVLYFFEEMSYEEIREVLHIPTSTVGVRLRRAKQALEALLQQYV
jgi:RNA polymerase sigma-70 factor (ECF subfamily)